MKLVDRINLTFMIPLVLTLGLWGWLSFHTMEKKIHADTDMILKEYSDGIVMRFLAGDELPERFNGVYNTYYLEKIDPDTAAEEPAVSYSEREAMVRNLEEFASTRIRSQIFQDKGGEYYRLSVSLPTFERDVLVHHVLIWTAVLFFVLLVAFLAIGALVVNYNMKPFHELLAWMDRYEPGVSKEPVPSNTDIEEFRRLADTARKTVERFEHQYEERKIFIGNASHELQTPLAACSNRIEMLLDSPDMTESLAEELVKLHRSLSGLIRLNKTLLLMSKIENGQFPQTDLINLTALMESTVQMYQDIFSSKEICCDMTVENEFSHEMDEQMASVLVTNLVRNAFQYSPVQGHVNISFSSEGFVVSNSGESALDKDKIFRRFYQPSGRREGSTGLGLALVHSVCVHNGLDISYDFRDSFHYFSVKLKNSK